MGTLIQRYKPAAPARVHLLLAAVMWTAVGAGLLIAGLRWTLASTAAAAGAPGAAAPGGARDALGETATSHGWHSYMPVLVAAAALLGLLKAELVLARTARRTIARIRARGDGRCIGGFLSWRSWGLVLLMMGLGFTLRHGLLPRGVVGVLYVMIGTALLAAARRFWGAWYTHPSS